METHEELVEEFRLEFGKKRRKKIKNLWFQLPLIIGVLAMMIFVEMLLYRSILELWSTRQDWFLMLVITFMGLVVLVFTGGIIYSLPSSFLRDYRISYLKKYASEQLRWYGETALRIEKSIKEIQDVINRQKELLEQINSPRFTRITSNPLYSDNVNLSLKKNEKSLKEYLKSLENCRDNIDKIRAELEVYDQTPEKTFWQYLKSGKWLKKIN